MDFFQNIEQRLDKLENLLLAQKKVLTFDEAAAYIGLSKSYLYKLTSTGGVPCYKPNGKQIYFDKQELEQWLLKHRKATTDELDSAASTHVTLNQGGVK